MFCSSCKHRWPGHTRCPECGAELIDLRQTVRQVRIERLPRLEDLARQFELGKQERGEPYHIEAAGEDDQR